jgi:glycosyltransferase involved in cell wall biosynthesis
MRSDESSVFSQWCRRQAVKLRRLRERAQRFGEIARSQGAGSSVRVALAYLERRYFPYRLVRKPVIASTRMHRDALQNKTDGIGHRPGGPRDRIVAMLVDAFTDGGVERVTIDLCRSLRDTGYTPAIIVAGRAGRSAGEGREQGLIVEELEGDPQRLAAWLRKVRPSLLVAHHCYFQLQQFKLAGIPIVEVLHNAYFWQSGDAYVRQQRRNNVDAWVAVSDFVKSYAVRYLGLPADRIAIIPNGLDCEALSRPPIKRLYAERLETIDKPVLAHVANLHPQKNHRGVLRAFVQVLRKYPTAKLKIAGALDGNAILSERLEADLCTLRLGESVEFLGYLHRGALSRLLTEAHVGLLPSRLEGSSLVSLEYAFFGLPSVLSDTGTARWLTETYGHALLASGCALPPERLNAWTIDDDTSGSREVAGAITAILDRYPYWVERAAAAAADSCTYSMGLTAKRYAELIDRMLESGSEFQSNLE